MPTPLYTSQCLEASEFGKVAISQLCTFTEGHRRTNGNLVRVTFVKRPFVIRLTKWESNNQLHVTKRGWGSGLYWLKIFPYIGFGISVCNFDPPHIFGSMQFRTHFTYANCNWLETYLLLKQLHLAKCSPMVLFTWYMRIQKRCVIKTLF